MEHVREGTKRSVPAKFDVIIFLELPHERKQGFSAICEHVPIEKQAHCGSAWQERTDKKEVKSQA